MTLADIRMRAVEQAGEQAAALGALDDTLTGYVNEGLIEFCGDGAIESKQIDVTNGECLLTDERIVEVLAVIDAQGQHVNAVVRDERLHVCPDGAYTLRCRVIPPVLEGDDDEPPLPEGYRGALADYAAYRLLMNGGRAQQQRGERFYQSFLRQASAYARMMDGARRTRRKNKFT